jgi:hypothetical protein
MPDRRVANRSDGRRSHGCDFVRRMSSASAATDLSRPREIEANAPRVCEEKLRLAAESLQLRLIVMLPEAISPTPIRLFCAAAVLKLPRQHPS